MNVQEQFETEQAEIMLDNEVKQYNERRAESIYKLLKRARAHRVLDVGCGLGKVTIYLAKRGINVTGIDISPRLIGLAREKARENNTSVDFYVVELSEFQPEEKFDAVLFAGVLEHIENDEKMMFGAKKFLKDGGKIVITVPCIPSLYNLRDKRIGHLRRYTKKSMARKLKSQGYTNIRQYYYSFMMIFGALFLQLCNKDEYPYKAVNPFTDKLIYCWYKYLENNFVFPIGEHLYAVAEKK